MAWLYVLNVRTTSSSEQRKTRRIKRTTFVKLANEEDFDHDDVNYQQAVEVQCVGVDSDSNSSSRRSGSSSKYRRRGVRILYMSTMRV